MRNQVEQITIPKFVKWAGGKTQLIEQLKPHFPKKIERYFEPFVGSGAVFFYIIQAYKPKYVFLSDTNEELINTYNVIKTDVERLIIELKQHKEYHVADNKNYYYEIRSVDPNALPGLERAARFIYLNKTCFNGLYRVNSKGKFNVPMGDYKNPDIVQDEKLRIIAELLKNVKVEAMHFEKIVRLTKKGDFVYFDPPYYPLKKKNSFTSYQKDAFMEKEQELLCKVFSELDKKGCFCMQSNSDTQFIKNLYSNYTIETVKAKRMINSNSKDRGEISEVLIKNY